MSDWVAFMGVRFRFCSFLCMARGLERGPRFLARSRLHDMVQAWPELAYSSKSCETCGVSYVAQSMW